MKKIICYLRGHVWMQLPYEDAPQGWNDGQWFYERHKCSRCGARRHELVASKLG